MAGWLVTGGCGFIGSHLVETLLKRGERVRVLDDLSTGRRHKAIEGAELVVGDVANRDLVARMMAGMAGCFHLAAVASVQRCTEDWLGAHRTNLTGTITVFEAARRGGTRPIPVVYASSAAVYGDNPRVPLDESAVTRPLSAYGADKLACELQARVAWTVHGIPNVGLRFFNVYGPRQDPRSPYSGVISLFIDRTLAGRNVEIHGDGRQSRDFVYIADVVAHLLAAMQLPPEGARVFNVCTGRGTTILDLAQAVAELLGRRPALHHGPPRAGDIRTSLGDPDAASDALGLRATVAIREGLRRTLDAIAAPAAAAIAPGAGGRDGDSLAGQ